MHGSVEKTSASLAALVQLGSESEEIAPRTNILKAIWEKVVKEGARLRGDFDVTCSGACEAAHQHDWALCAYLAAVCFCVEGASALAEPSCRWQNAAWTQIVAPILVDVPPGRERLRVKVDDCADEEWIASDQVKWEGTSGQRIRIKGRGRATFFRAEYFKEGGSVQPVKFKRFRLPETAISELFKLIKSETGVARRSSFLLDANDLYPLSHIPGVRYHVLAYPFVGDVTKALLRPQVDSWSQLQRNVVQKLSETLVSKCAKAGKWDFVEILLAAGVPCPDLTREFESICDHSSVVQKAWLQDLYASSGSAYGRASLLELAAWQPVVADRQHNMVAPLQAVLAGLSCSGQDQDFHSHGRLTLMRVAAERGRWDVVFDVLLAARHANLCVGSLLDSRAMAFAPLKVRLLAEERFRQEQRSNSEKPCESLKDYFTRQVLGRVPRGFVLIDGVLKSQGGLRVLDCCFRLGHRLCKEHVFVSISESDMEKAKETIKDPTNTILTLDLNHRECCLEDPCAFEAGRCWISVLSEACYFKQSESGKSSLICIPPNQLACPYIVRKYPIRAMVVSPCCAQPLMHVPLYVCESYVGTTNSEGVATFELPPGQFIIKSPGYACGEEAIEIKPGQTSPLEVQLIGTGEVFIYLMDQSFDVPKDSVFLCANRDHIDAEEAACLVGSATMPECHGLFIPKGTHRDIYTPRTCFEKISQIKIISKDGRVFEESEESVAFFEESKHECVMALVFNTTPKLLGDLKGLRPPENDTLRAASAPSHNMTTKPCDNRRQQEAKPARSGSMPSLFKTSPKTPDNPKGPRWLDGESLSAALLPPTPCTSLRFAKPMEEPSLWQLDGNGRRRSSGLIFQAPSNILSSVSCNRLPLERRSSPGLPTRIDCETRRPNSANPSTNVYRSIGSVCLRPSSASRGRLNPEAVTFSGKVLSLRSLRSSLPS